MNKTILKMGAITVLLFFTFITAAVAIEALLTQGLPSKTSSDNIVGEVILVGEEVLPTKPVTIKPQFSAQKERYIVMKREPVESPKKEVAPSYYIDIKDGYITEDSIHSICTYVGDMYDISPELLQAIVWSESRYEVKALSSCNAKGLCQIMGKWHRERMERLEVSDIYDPYGNVLICADIIDDYKGKNDSNDIRFVLMLYNMKHSTAKSLYKSGIISEYATNVLAKCSELESLYNKQ